MSPQDALLATAKSLHDKRSGKMPEEAAVDPLMQQGGIPSDMPMPQFGAQGAAPMPGM